MYMENCYNVTEWSVGDAHNDIGEVINSIICDIKRRQSKHNTESKGKPGALIYIPPGDYHLRTQVVIDISYLKIAGSGHGFVSSSIRYNRPEKEWETLHEIWPGGSRILVELEPDGKDEIAGSAFLVKRQGNPRISSVEFENFCIDGLHFEDDGLGVTIPENTYTNNKTGIYVASEQDSFRITGMGFVYLEHGITVYNADALSIHDNFIAECGSCVEIRGWAQTSKITDNFCGAGYKGHTIYAENAGGLLITSNNVFPRGKSSIYLKNVSRSSITSNRLHSFYPGMCVLSGNSSENLIASNHFLRDNEPWAPLAMVDNGLDDDYGLISISGSHNTIVANHISESVEVSSLRPRGVRPVIINLVSGKDNYVSTNHVVVTAVDFTKSDSCFDSQVAALTRTDEPAELDYIMLKENEQ